MNRRSERVWTRGKQLEHSENNHVSVSSCFVVYYPWLNVTRQIHCPIEKMGLQRQKDTVTLNRFTGIGV